MSGTSAAERRCGILRKPVAETSQARQRLKWTLGLCWIFLVLPLTFLLPRSLEQVRQRSFAIADVRAREIVARSLELIEALPAHERSAEKVRIIFSNEYRRSLLSRVARITLALNGHIILDESAVKTKIWLLRGYRPREGGEAILLDARFTDAGFDLLEVLIASPVIPFSRDIHLVLFDIIVLVFALLAGGIAIYRLWLVQIELVEEHGRFISAVTHELKTPLSSIQLYAEMLSSGWGNDPDAAQRYGNVLLREASRLKRLVDNVLRYGGLVGGTGEMRIGNHSLGRLIERVVQEGVAITAGNGVDVKAVPLPDTLKNCSVAVDDDAFVQVVFNILDNAVKFSQFVGAREILLGWREGDVSGAVIFFVRDFGCGLPEGESDRIFRPFYRADSEATRSVPGTGIGLALVEELVRAMGGCIRAKNANPGAEFQVEFRTRQSEG